MLIIALWFTSCCPPRAMDGKPYPPRQVLQRMFARYDRSHLYTDTARPATTIYYREGLSDSITIQKQENEQ